MPLLVATSAFINSNSVTVLKSRLKTFLFSQAFSFSPLTNTGPGPVASEVTTLWRYTDIDMGKEVVELTVGALGGDSVREFGGFSHTDLVLGTDPQHVLVAGDQADDAELGSRVGGRADRHVHRLGRVALLHDVPAIHTLLS